MADDVDLLRAGGLTNPVDERGQLCGALLYGTEPADRADRPGSARNGSVVEGVDAVAIVGEERDVGAPVGLGAAAGTVHQHDWLRVLGRRLAVPVVGPGQRTTGIRQLVRD